MVERAAPGLPLEVPTGIRTISVRAAPDEQLLAFAALGELCRPLQGLIDQLPPAQQAAIEGALALGPPEGDMLAVAVAFRSLLHLAAEREPLLVVMEEAHLVDRGSASALAYAARRLGDVAVGIVVAQDPTHPGRLELPGVPRLGGDPYGQGMPEVSAATLRRAIERAEARGSIADVAAAHEAAAATSNGDHRVTALVDAGHAWLDAGAVDRARAVAAAAEASAHDKEDLARVELLLGRIAAMLGRGRQSVEHYRAAATLAAPSLPEVAARALLLLTPAMLFAGRIEEAEAALAEAGELLTAAGSARSDPLRQLLGAALAATALATARSTDASSVLSAASQSALAAGADISSLITMVGLPLIWVERNDVAMPLLRGLVDGLRNSGAWGALPMPLCALALGERRAGNLTRALIFASEAKDIATQTGDRAALVFAQSELANTHSMFGDVDRCRVAAELVLQSSHHGIYRTSVLSALATVELWSGDPAKAVELLEPLVTAGDALGPMVTLFHPTLITAYVAVGRRDDALPLLAQLERATPPGDGRLRTAFERCRALLAPRAERDRRFAEAIERAGEAELSRSLTRLLYARTLLADGEATAGAALLHELSDQTDENLLGVARAARFTLTRLGMAVGGGDPAWARLSPAELEVALAAAEGTPVLALADRLRLSPPEIERLRDDVLAVVGARSGPAVATRLHQAGGSEAAVIPPIEVRLLGGLRVLVDGQPVPVPAGAVSKTIALIALRRAVHVEELTEVLWPDADPEVARRRLRNVLRRVRQAAGSLVVRVGDRLELAPEVVVDHHLLETQARRALAEEPGQARIAAIEAALDAHIGTLLPGLLYEDWTQPARARAELREEELKAALEAERASHASRPRAGSTQTGSSARRNRS